MVLSSEGIKKRLKVPQRECLLDVHTHTHTHTHTVLNRLSLLKVLITDILNDDVRV